MIIRYILYTTTLFFIVVSSSLAQTDPIIALSSSNTVMLENESTMGGDLCLFLDYPSQAGQSIPIVFTIADLEDQPSDLQVEATSSNILVVPQLDEFLTLTQTGNQVTLKITPIKSGSSSIRVIVEDSNWDADAFNIHLTVKECKPILCIATDDINVLMNNQPQLFQTSNQIKSDATISVGDNITYQAGHTIDLLAGFNNPLGSLFTAVIQDCQ